MKLTNIKLSDDIILIIESCKEEKNQELIKEKITTIKNWDDFISLSYSHGVFPLVYHALKEYKDILPQDLFLKLKSINMDISKYNMLMTSELIKVMKLLEENDIEAISFKGPTLSQSAYGDITLRQYVDLDILIKEEDLEKTYEILEINDLISTIEKEYVNNKLFLEKNSDITFINKKNGINIEIHWKLFRNKFLSNLNNKNFFDEKYKIKVNNYDINIFYPEILLVYLCMHGSKHKWERIEWITDINKLLIKEQNIDWELIFKIAKSYACTKMLYLGIYISYLTYNSSIPKIYLKELEKETYQNMLKHIFEEMVKLNKTKSEIEKNLDSVKFHYLLHETFYEKVKFLKKTFFEISDNDTRSFNSNSLFLHYTMKLFRLLKKYISGVFK